jgi:flagellin
MGQVINTNVLSLNAQRNLARTQGDLAQALQRLSSGLRINSAKDDAAGLAITERFTTQIRGINQAIRNANDGISLAQTAEGALGELTNNLQRIRELAVQAANATNSASDRAALDEEVQQRLAEIDRIATQTAFNDQTLLDGTFGDATFQVGANVGQTIGITLETSMRQADLGSVATATSVDLSGLITEDADAIETDSTALGAITVDYVSTVDAQNFTLAIDGIDVLDVTQAGGAETIDTATLQAAFDAFDTAEAGYTIAGTLAGGDLVVSKLDGTDMAITLVHDFGTAGTTTGSGAFVATHTGGTAAVVGAPLTVADLTIQLGDADAVTVANGDYDTVQAFVDAVNGALGSNATATLDADTNILSIVSGESVTIGGTDAGTVFSATSFTAAGSLAAVNVLSASAANDAIYRIDASLTSVSSLRSTFGAIQNRFESTIANLSAVSENLTASRSRIQDADFAAETAALTRAQILQQAGTAILAQANASPQTVLALLQ